MAAMQRPPIASWEPMAMNVLAAKLMLIATTLMQVNVWQGIVAAATSETITQGVGPTHRSASRTMDYGIVLPVVPTRTAVVITVNAWRMFAWPAILLMEQVAMPKLRCVCPTVAGVSTVAAMLIVMVSNVWTRFV